MPEIWLNYGGTEVVLDIRAENLGQNIGTGGDVMDDQAINERLAGLDLARPAELAVMHGSRSVQRIISSIFSMCEQKSLPFPKILADKRTAGQIRHGLPEGSTVDDLADPELNSDLVFVAEVGFDGLFGYETVSTRLVRRFGHESMLSAYAGRNANVPSAGQATGSFAESTKFADQFEIRAIEIASSSAGVADLAIGHPSKTWGVARALESLAVRDIGGQKSMIISTGRQASNDSLAGSLSSLWNCMPAMKKDGIAVLVAECQAGLGSDAMQQYIEGRLSPDQLKSPGRYVDGMEDLLYLQEAQRDLQVGIVSALPEFYTKKLGMVFLPGVRQSMEYILRTLGPRQKITVVSDGARLLLRQ